MTQVCLFATNEKYAERLKTSHKESVEKQKDIWADTFRDAGWETNRFLKKMRTCDDFYTSELAQIRMKQLHSGRVVLLRDAGYCPRSLTGMGTTASLVGSYVLAGELAEHGSDVSAALKAYREVMRALIDSYFQMLEEASGFHYPSSRFGAWLLRSAARALSSLKIDGKFQRILPENKSSWSIPECPELNIVS